MIFLQINFKFKNVLKGIIKYRSQTIFKKSINTSKKISKKIFETVMLKYNTAYTVKKNYKEFTTSSANPKLNVIPAPPNPLMI